MKLIETNLNLWRQLITLISDLDLGLEFPRLQIFLFFDDIYRRRSYTKILDSESPK